MKNAVKLIGIFAIMALIGLCFGACEEPKSEPELPALTGTVSITGIAQVGEKLTVDTSALKGSGGIFYKWERNGTSHTGSGNYYFIDETDIGSFITVTVTCSGCSGSVTSAPTAIVTDASFPVLGGMVSVSGTAMVGQIFTADTSGLGGSGTITYQWMRNETDVIGTDSTYTVQNADIGSSIIVTVTRADNSGSVTSQPTIPVTDPSLPALTGTVSVNGTAQVGQTLTANTSALGGSGTIYYQWRQNGTTVVGTNSPTYTVTTAGYTINVTVTCSENSGSITSASTGAAADDPSLPPIVGNVNVNGITQVGQALTADISSLGGSGTIHYRWQRNGTDIGTNSNTYILIYSDVGSTITVSVSRQGYSGKVTSAPTTVIVSDLDANGLRYRLINHNTAYSVSKGTATIADIIIPSVYNGLPVTTIPENGFSNYINLTSIVIPESITEVGYNAFSGCTNPSITWNYNPEAYINDYYFDSYVKVIYISDSVMGIGDYTFSDCSSLETINVNAINQNYSSQDGILYNKAKTEIIFIPYEIKGSITIPDGVTYIDGYAFYQCTGLTSVTIPSSVTSIGSSAFYGCTNLSITWNYNPEAYIDGYYSYLKNYLKTVIISNSVTSIGDYVFQYYSGLTSVTIGNSVTSIGDYAFQYCSGLTSVTIGNNVTSIGDYAFQYCSGLTSVTIGNSVTSIGYDAFLDCTGLTSINVNINNPEYSSQDGILYNKDKTRLIYVPSGISGTIVISNSVTSIGYNAFRDCTGLTSITIPNSVTIIDYGAFYGCTGLTSITIPNSVTYIGNYAFSGCINLSITWNYNPELDNSYNSYFKNYLKTVIISNSVTSIGDYAFYGCTGLTSVTIGTITSANFGVYAGFPGNLRVVYFTAGGGAGTYVTSNPGDNAVWTKQ